VLGVGAARLEHQVPIDAKPWTTTVPRPLSDVDREALTVLVSVDGLGPLTLGRLLDGIGSPSEVLAVAARDGGRRLLIAATTDPFGESRAIPGDVLDALIAAAGKRNSVLRSVRDHGLRVVAPGDFDYPDRLLRIEVPPPALFVRGEASALAGAHAIGIVGTRRPTEMGRRVATRIATAIARAGAVIVSGLAVGIDGAAHAAAVSEDAPTVAFIGGGHARLFPPAHARLAEAIVATGGVIVSEFPPEAEATRGTFPRRNRLISGAADAVVVVEAGARSGALLTASWALEQGRECFLVPGPIDAPMSAGCLGFLRDWPGAARIVAGVPQLLDDLGLAPAAAFPLPARADGPSSSATPASAAAILASATPAERSVAAALVSGAVIVDELVAVTGLSVPGVLGALTRLEALGLATGRYGRFEPAGSLALEPPAQPKRTGGGR
jgi:DNA processing protein